MDRITRIICQWQTMKMCWKKQFLIPDVEFIIIDQELNIFEIGNKYRI